MGNNDKNQKNIQTIALSLAIPFFLCIPPIVGWFIGSWLDKKFHTDPIFMYLFIVFGFAAGFREVYRVIRRIGNDS